MSPTIPLPRPSFSDVTKYYETFSAQYSACQVGGAKRKMSSCSDKRHGTSDSVIHVHLPHSSRFLEF